MTECPLQLRLADALRFNQRGTLERSVVAQRVDHLKKKKEAKVIRSRRYGSGTPHHDCNFKLRGAAITPGENTLDVGATSLTLQYDSFVGLTNHGLNALNSIAAKEESKEIS